MVTDFINWLYKYENGNFSDVWHCFNYPGLHQFFHLINFSIYKIIGTNTTAWYIVLSMMHGINAYMVFHLSQYFWREISLEKREILIWSLLAAFLFLIFPYNIEAVVWKACLHYLITLFFLLSGIHFLLKYWRGTNYFRSIFFTNLLFVLALFTLELSFVFPFIFLTIILIYKVIKPERKLKNDIVKIFFPQIVLLILYIFLSKLFLGNFVGHYGAEKHLVLDLNLITSNAWKYFFKNVFYCHFLDFQSKAFIYESALSNPWVIYGISVITFIICLFTLKKGTSKSILLLGNLVIFFLCIAPIVTLYFYWQHPFENDRYGYFASVFFIIFILGILSYVRNKSLRNILLGLYVFINIFFFIKLISNAHDAAIVQHELLSNFQVPISNDTIFLLSVPDNYRGLYLFRDHKNNAHILRKSLSLMYDKNFDNIIIDVAQFNQNNIEESTKVDFVDDKTIHVGFKQKGNWFWKGGIGLDNYESELFNVERKPGYYKLTFKNPSRDQLFLYTENNKWQMIRWPN